MTTTTPRRFAEFFRRLLRQGDGSTPLAPAVVDPASVVAMLRALGVAMLTTGRATNDVLSTLEQVARTYGRSSVRLLVLPTAVVIQHVGDTITTEIDTVEPMSARLDQVGAVDAVVKEARAGTIDPSDVPRRLDAIDRSSPRFGPIMQIIGHTVLTLGFGMVLNPSREALPAYLVLGAVVGVLLAIGRVGAITNDLMPIVAAFTVTVLTDTVLEGSVRDDLVRIIAPPLVSFLPGMVLTIAAIELTNGQVVAGASRIVYGIARLMFLAFGLVAGITAVGETVATAPGQQLGWWAPLVGVLLIAGGYTLFSSAPPGAFVWFVVVLFLVQSAQRLGNEVLSPELSGFFGAVILVPLTRAIETLPRAPSSSVTMLPALWLLVPGALGFIGITEAATDTGDSVETLVATGLSLLSISLGVLVGSGLVRDLRHARRTWISTA
jgi:uncharacterized membrane protein YjjP (DUF1212 family)